MQTFIVLLDGHFRRAVGSIQARNIVQATTDLADILVGAGYTDVKIAAFAPVLEFTGYHIRPFEGYTFMPKTANDEIDELNVETRYRMELVPVEDWNFKTIQKL